LLWLVKPAALGAQAINPKHLLQLNAAMTNGKTDDG
jgi:hypothetical protein